MTATAADWDALARATAGELLLPGMPEYETARRPALPRFQAVRPQAVVRCANAADVAETIAFARTLALPVAARSGGHCFAGGSSTDGIVIDVSPLDSVVVDGDRAQIGAGARLAAVYDALAAAGRTLPAGCGPTVGIAGLTLGGGLGVLGRLHGLLCDSLLGAEVVLADGQVVECGEGREDDLLWALRGGGGGAVGVVTSLRFATVPEPAVTTFHLDWPFERAADVVAAWLEWAPDGPDELAASLHVSAGRDLARPPAVTVFGTLAEGESEAGGLLAALVARAGADPERVLSAQLPYSDAKRHLVEEGERREQGFHDPAGHLYGKSEFFRRSLPPDAIAALVAGVAEGRAGDHSRKLDFMPWGGAYNRVAPGATAFPHRAERFLLAHDAVADAGAEPAGARAWLARSWGIAHPFGTGGVYANFPDPELPDPAAAYHGANAERLRRVRERYDPDAIFAVARSA